MQIKQSKAMLMSQLDDVDDDGEMTSTTIAKILLF